MQRLHELVRASKPAAFMNRQAHLCLAPLLNLPPGWKVWRGTPREEIRKPLATASNSYSQLTVVALHDPRALKFQSRLRKGHLAGARRALAPLVPASWGPPPRPSPSQELRVELLPFGFLQDKAKVSLKSRPRLVDLEGDWRHPVQVHCQSIEGR